MSKTYSAGIVTAYGAAKRAGYQGTYEDFCRQQAGYAENAAAVEQAKTTAVNAASTATTKAGEATTAATAAQTAKTQTEQAASQALTDISTARSGAISAVQTEGQTQTANARAQAQAAAQSATTASTKASEASTSAMSAGQSATNAAASATSAANAASAAQAVKDSIPENYSDLSEDVDKLKADLGAVDVFLHHDSETILSRNRIDSSKVVSGLLQSDATVVATSNRVTSDFIKVTDNTPYRLCYWDSARAKIVNGTLRYSLYYNAEKEIIGVGPGGNGTSTGTFTANGLAYVRISYNEDTSSTTMLLLGDTSTTGITAYIQYSETVVDNYGKKYKVVANGDSITFGHKPAMDGYDGMTNGVSYMTMACEELGFELDNYSISMSTLAYDVSGNDAHTSLIGRYQNMSNDADLVYIAIGSNDWFYATGTSGFQLGVFEDRVNNTFYGALHLLCAGLKQKYGAIPIVFATPIKRWIIREEGETIPGNLNARSKAISEWATAIKEVCEYYGIPVVDMYSLSYLNAWTDYDRANFVPDGIHPNLAGHQRMKIECEAVLRKFLPAI